MGHATFTYEYYENTGAPKGLSNAANVIHSTDAYILRCMHRRCNYDPVIVNTAYTALQQELDLRVNGYTIQIDGGQGDLFYYLTQYDRSGIADVVILPFIKSGYDTQYISDDHIKGLIHIIEMMLQHQPFELVTIHDAFKSHPNNVNWVRFHYKEILAELAESNLIEDLIRQITGHNYQFVKLSSDLGDKIRESEYALC